MSPLINVLFSWLTRCPRGLSSWMAVLFSVCAVLVPSRAWAQSDGCISSRKQVEMDGQTYTVITIDAHEAQADPKGCNLYIVRFVLPIKNPETDVLLGPYEYGRAVYAANQNWQKYVTRQCAPTVNHQPPPDATEEERQACPYGRANYVATPSNGWKAPIRIPTKPVKTWAEKQQTAAQVACAEAKSAEAQQKCREAGQSTAGSSAGGPPAKSPLEEENARLQQQLTEANAKVADMTKRLAETDQALATAKSQAAADNHPYFWYWVIGLCLMLGLTIVVEESRIKSYREQVHGLKSIKPSDPTLPPSVGTLRAQLEEADERAKAMDAELSEVRREAKRQLELDDEEIKRLRTEREGLEKQLAAKGQETTDLREELARKNREVQTADAKKADELKAAVDAAVAKTIAENTAVQTSTERDNANLRNDIKNVRNENARLTQEATEKDAKITAQQDEIDRLAGELAQYAEPEDPTVAEPGADSDLLSENQSLKDANQRLLREKTELEQRLQAAQAAAASQPPSVTPLPTPSVTPLPTPSVTPSPDEPDSQEPPPMTLRGLPSMPPGANLTADRLQQIVLESDAFRHGTPEVIRLIGEDPKVHDGTEPAALMVHIIQKLASREQELKAAEQGQVTAEAQVQANMGTIANLSDSLQQTEQAKTEAVSRATILQGIVDKMHDNGTDSDKKALDALFKAAKLEEELVVLRQFVQQRDNGSTQSSPRLPTPPPDPDGPHSTPEVTVGGTMPPGTAGSDFGMRPSHAGFAPTAFKRTLPPPSPDDTGSDDPEPEGSG